MDILSYRKHWVHVSYVRQFEWSDMPGAGFSFDCDEHGKLLPSVGPIAVSNYQECLTGMLWRLQGVEYRYEGEDLKPLLCTGHWVQVRMMDLGIRKYEQAGWDPAVGLCCCGEKVELYGFTNTCNCGRDYNMSGQELAPRSQWGEETGESVSDILSVDSEGFDMDKVEY